jgi:hypothetical protein
VLLALALALPGLAYLPIVRNFFMADDFFHLYHIVNKDRLEFLLNMHGGHLLMTRNALFILSFDVFGTAVAAYFWVVLATHLLNVFLLFRIIRDLTASARLACFGAALWGVLPVQEGTLGWYSVYGHAVTATCTLLVLAGLARAAAGRPVRAAAPLLWTLLLLAGATSFGVGIGVAFAMPVVALLLLPASPLRRRTVLVFAALAIALPFVYFRLERLYVELYGGVPPSLMLTAGLQFWHQHVELFAQLIGYGISAVVLGVLHRPLFYPSPAGYAVAAAGAAVLLAVLARGDSTLRRRILACLALCAGAYGIIAAGRGMFMASGSGWMAQMTRFHYVASAALVVAACLALAQMATWWRWSRRAGTTLLLVWAGLSVLAQQWLGVPIRHFDAARWETTWALEQIRTAARAAAPAADVYIENQVFKSVGLRILARPGAFPGWAALYSIYFPDDLVDGRRIYFVEPDPNVIEAARDDRRTGALLVAPSDASADVYRPPHPRSGPAPEPQMNTDEHG